MKTIAEQFARIHVKRFYEDMNNDDYKGTGFNPSNFDIETSVDIMIHIYYKRKCSLKSRLKAARLARKLWNKLWKLENPQRLKSKQARDYGEEI
jgi:hypothetical protein